MSCYGKVSDGDKDDLYETRSFCGSNISSASRAERKAKMARLAIERQNKRQEFEKQMEIERKNMELEDLRIEGEMRATMAELSVLGSQHGSNISIPEMIADVAPVEPFYKPRSLPGVSVGPFNQPSEPVNDAGDSVASALSRLADVLTERQSKAKLPPQEPDVFSGDPLQFSMWMGSFESIVEDRVDESGCLYYLKRYTSGEAREVVKGFLSVRTAESYRRAKAVLRERFGDQLTTFNVLRDKLYQWPVIANNDGKALAKFSDFLQYCLSLSFAIPALRYLDDPRENQRLLQKLPDRIVQKWAVVVDDWRVSPNRSDIYLIYPPFQNFCEFLQRETRLACDPITSLEAIRPKIEQKTKPERHRQVRVSCYTQVKDDSVCSICDNSHETHQCPALLKLDSSKRHTLVRNKNLCLRCLKTGHHVRECKSNHRCSICSGQHASQLHSDKDAGKCPCCEQRHFVLKCPQFKAMSIKDRWGVVRSKGLCSICFSYGHKGDSCSKGYICPVDACGLPHSKYLHLPSRDNGSSQVETAPDSTPRSSHFTSSSNMKLALPIVPVRVRSSDSSKHFNTYALLDSGSNSTYCSRSLCERLGASGSSHQIELTTIAEAKIPLDVNVTTLFISDVNEKIDEYRIPHVTVCPTLNIDLSGLANRLDVEKWPHLRNIELPELPVGEVELLIGQDCSDLLIPNESRVGQPGEPFAVRTPLGWAVNGPIDCHSLFTKSSYFVRSQPSNLELARMWEIEGIAAETVGMASCDRKVLDTWDQTKTVDDGHYSIKIPFKSDPSILPNNRILAEKRLLALRKRLDRDANFNEYNRWAVDSREFPHFI